MLRIALVLVALLVAGASSLWETEPSAAGAFVPRAAGGSEEATSAGPIVFRTPLTLPRSGNFSEPTVVVDANGAIYLAAPGARTATWRSFDGGATFERAASTTGEAGDSDMAVDAMGRVYVSDLNPLVPVHVSSDGLGSYDRVVQSAFDVENDRQWLAAHGDGHVYSAWLVQWPGTGAGERAIFLAASHDAGETYEVHEVVLHGVRYLGKIRATSDTDVWVPYVTGTREAMLAHSGDGGRTWSTHYVAQLPGNSLIFPAVAFDDAGTAYYAWASGPTILGRFDTFSEVYLTSSADGGETWSAPTQLSSSARYDVFPWVVAGAPGRVAVVWYEGEPPATLQLDPTYATLASWRVAVAFSPNADAASPEWSRTLATDVIHEGPVCTLGGNCATVRNPLALDRRLLDYIEAAALPDGNLVFAHPYDIDPTNGATRLHLRVQESGPNLRR